MKTKMTDIKLSAIYSGNVFQLEFYPKPLDGEKLTKTDENCLEQIEIDIDTMPENVKHAAMLHGFKQKFCDNLAMTKELKQGTTVEAASEMTKDLEQQLLAGNWNAVGKSAKQPKVTLDAVTTGLIASVKAGLMTYDAANTFSKNVCHKELDSKHFTDEEIEA